MSTKNAPAYLEALKRLSQFDSPCEGLVHPAEESTGTKIQKILKQNNCIIDLLVQVHEKLEKLQEKLDSQQTVVKELPEIEDLITKLSNLSLGTKSSYPARREAPFYVFKDPKIIWKEERAKIYGPEK